MAIRNSKQRNWIYEVIQKSPKHLTADEIYECLQMQGKNISVATVYRNLRILVAEHQIAEVVTDSKKQVYDKTCKLHEHFICTLCHQVYDIDVPYDRMMDRKYSKELGMLVQSHTLTLYGICNECLKTKEEVENNGIKRI